MIEREITRDYSGERSPQRPGCLVIANCQYIGALLDINRQIANRSDKSVADLLPMKYLP